MRGNLQDVLKSRREVTLLQKVHNRCLSVGRIRRRISVDLPGVPGGLPPVRRHPFFDRVVRLVHAVVRPAVDGNGSFAPWRFGRVHLARSFKCACDLDAEVAQYRCTRLRVVVEEDVVAVNPQPRLAANEIPDLAHRSPPRRANRVRSDLAPHRGQLSGVNSLYVDGDRHSSIIDRNRDAKSRSLYRRALCSAFNGRVTALSGKWTAEMETSPFSFRFTDN